ncbi:MAG: hypothetical protein Q4C53_04550 [Clostridia bacterium]|nr:hypothetical protein [Clostridia bacterium]
MKHCILVKLTPEGKERLPEMLPEIRALFEQTLSIEGVTAIDCKRNCIDRPNRSDLLIEMTMTEGALPVYDASEPHRQWKEGYGKYIASKAIFDFED